jgi:hypothetical protein
MSLSLGFLERLIVGRADDLTDDLREPCHPGE